MSSAFRRRTIFFLLLAFALLLPRNSFAETDWAKKQVYWDGVKSPPLPSGSSCDAALKARTFKAIEDQYGHPPLIAIGDSLYNGVQSLRINWWLSEWSAPVTVAIRLGLIKEKNADRNGDREFYVPQYPHHGDPNYIENFGFDLEHVPFDDFPILGLVKEADDLIKDFRNQGGRLRYLYHDYLPPNGRAVVDNLAFSGADSMDLVHWKIGDFKKAADAYTDRLIHIDLWDLTKSASTDLSSAFLFSNAYFVLNPTKNRCLDDLTVLELVKLRKPQRVIINVGANNGLWKLAFEADRLKDPACDKTDPTINYKPPGPRCPKSIRLFTRNQLLADIQTIVTQLSSVKGLDGVYINELVRPTQVANLIPAKSPNGGLCFTSYLFRTSKCVPLSVTKEQDKFIDGVNEEIVRIIQTANKPGTKPQFYWVDLPKTLAAYDFKRCLWNPEPDCKRRRLHISEDEGLGRGQDQYFDNRPLSVRGQEGPGKGFVPKVVQGGLFSFDNMHLSSVGYEILAKAVQDAMEPHDNQIAKLLPDHCKPDEENQPGDCIGLLVHPGWSYLDATRRDVMLLRIAGSQEEQRISEFNALVSFGSGLFGGN